MSQEIEFSEKRKASEKDLNKVYRRAYLHGLLGNPLVAKSLISGGIENLEFWQAQEQRLYAPSRLINPVALRREIDRFRDLYYKTTGWSKRKNHNKAQYLSGVWNGLLASVKITNPPMQELRNRSIIICNLAFAEADLIRTTNGVRSDEGIIDPNVYLGKVLGIEKALGRVEVLPIEVPQIPSYLL